MQIDSTAIVEKIYADLKDRVGELQKKNITPHLVVFFIGDDPSSAAYIRQKEKQATVIGAKVTVLRFENSITTEELEEKIKLLNEDPFVHGILIQRPVPKHVNINKLELLTNPQKDIDGFHPDSPYTLPLPLAVIKILQYIYAQGVAEVGAPSSARNEVRTSDGGRTEGRPPANKVRQGWANSRQDPVMQWLANQYIVILGKGQTGGKPVIEYLRKLNVEPHVIDSQTPNPEEILKQADIVISAVGKPGVIKPETLKPGVILIGVGMTQGEPPKASLAKGGGKKLHGDYAELEIKDIASFHTPTPKGVGPVNVSMLMDNLVTATERQT